MSCRRSAAWAAWVLPLLPLLVLACGEDDKPPTSGGLDPRQPRAMFSELMYHPVREDNPQELHEYIEIHNLAAVPMDLGGARIAGGVRFTFPAGTTLPGGAYLVVAKNRAQLLAVAGYGLQGDRVLGDYDGELDNDGERIVLE